jgi:fatty acid desaturase
MSSRRRYHRTTYRRRFPVLAVLVLVFAGTWLLRELEIIGLNLPWLPVVLIVIALGVIFNRLLG